MRFSVTTTSAFGLALIAFSPSLVLADYPVEIRDLRTSNRKNHKKKNLGQTPASSEIRLLVKYSSEYGKSDLALFGKNETIDVDLSQYNVASITTSKRNIRTLENDPNIVAVEIDYEMYAMDDHLSTSFGANVPSRRLVENQGYGISMVQADQLSFGDTPIKICVVDTGYAEGHPDLPTTASHGVDGWNDPTGAYGLWNFDVHGHGTHCTGIICGIGGNNQGVVGVNNDPTQFRLFIAKGLSDAGSGPTSNVLAAVQECADSGAQVISMSLGGTGYSSIAEGVYKDLYDQGILIVAAAGNGSSSDKSYPASYPQVVSVAAVDSNKNKASFSQWNDQVEVAAPGVDIVSTATANGGNDFTYASWSGTSMAVPYVTGVAALVWSHFPECTNNQIRNVLLKTAEDAGISGCDRSYGYGIVQARRAYELLFQEGCIAGGGVTSPLSIASLGGCEQSQDNSSPTMAPSCNGSIRFQLDLLTDDYPEETSWEVKDIKNNIVASGSGYTSKRSIYTENACLSAEDSFTFTIFDIYSDGICCLWGTGSYTIHVDGESMFTGDGEFGRSESVSFGPMTSSSFEPSFSPTHLPTALPTTSPTIRPCEDSLDWKIMYKGQIKTCSWVASRPTRRCKLDGAMDACRIACNSC